MNDTNLTFKVIKVSNHGTNYQYVCHVFLDKKYLNSVIFDLKYGEDSLHNINAFIETNILEKSFNDTKYAFKRTGNVSNPKFTIHNYNVSVNKKDIYQRVKEKYNNVGSSSPYYHNYSIISLNSDYIESYCWDANYKDEGEFNVVMCEQANVLCEYIKTITGVKIEIKTPPKYRDMTSGLGRGRVKFFYNIVKVAEAKILDTIDEKRKDKKEKTGSIGKLLNNAIINFIFFRFDYNIDILSQTKPEKKCNLYQATDDMFRMHCYLYFIKDVEDRLILDHDNYKNLLIKKMWNESRFDSLSATMLTSFRKVMPKLYKVMFGNLPETLIPSLMYANDKENLELAINKFETPKLELK